MANRHEYAIFKAEKALKKAEKGFDANIRINAGAFCSKEENVKLEAFKKDLNGFRGEFIQDAKSVLPAFGADEAFKAGFGIHTRQALSFVRISKAFYQVLRAEFELKMVKGEIEEEEYKEFLGEE